MINKNKFILFLLFLLIIAIPVSFASDNSTSQAIGENIEVANDTLTISDDSEILGAGDVYFDASASSNGDGSQSRPYNTVTSSNLGTKNHFAPGTYRISSGLSSYTSYDGMSFIGQNKDTTILQYLGSDTFIKTSNSITFNGITIKGGSIQTSGGTLTATDTIFDSGKAVEETESDNYKYGNSYGGAIKQAASTGLDWGSIFGGGSSSGQTMIFNNCIFKNNFAAYGGAIYSEKGTITITNSKFENNHAENGGGAIAALNGVKLTVTGCEFTNDYSSYDAGGAIYLFNVTSASIQNSHFNNCNAAIGGAVASLISPVTITGSNFNSNKANWIGGAVFSMYGSLTVKSSNFYENSAYHGGAIYADNLTNFEVNGGTFQKNVANGSAGAIFAFTNNVNKITNPTYISNNANEYDDLYQTDRIPLNIGSDDYEMIQYKSSYTGSLPSRYDLRTVGGVTPVKDQGQSGNCWAFATMATLESAILKATGKQVILSEGNLKNLANMYSDIGWRYETNNGGMYPFVYGYLTSWAGPVLASLDPTDDWDVIAPIINSAVHVQNILFLQRTSFTDNNAIKKAIMDYGSVCSEIYWSSSYLNGNNYYYNGDSGRNHAISVVGWDDTKTISGAPGAGAWIIKNSYGSHRGDGGYYYVSYYDKSLFRVYDESYNSFAVVFNDTVRFNKNYQYDASFTDYFLTSTYNKVMWYKNTFTSTGNDILSAFSTYFRKTTNWEAQIYVNNELKLTQTGKANPGYWTINLAKEIPLTLGDSFTISLKIECSSTADIPISEYGAAYTLVKEYFQPGVSFFSTDGVTWRDFYGYKASFGSGDSGHNYYNQVACLKAFTKEGPKEFLNTTCEIISYNSTSVVVSIKDQRNGNVNIGEVEIIIDGVKEIIKVSSSKAVLNTYLKPGSHTINVNYLKNDYYNQSATSKSITMPKEDPVIVISADNINYGQDLEVKVTLTNAIGQVITLPFNVEVNGKNYNSNEFRVSGLTPNNYTIKVQTTSTDDFNPQYSTKTIAVSKLTPTLNLEIDDVNLGENITIKAKLSNSITGNVNVVINGAIHQIRVENGEGSISITNALNAGQYTATAEYDGNEYYSNVKSDKSFNVNKLDPKMSIADREIVQGKNASLVINLAEDIDAILSLNVNSKIITSKAISGEVIFNISELAVGNYTFTVTFTGNAKYQKGSIQDTLSIVEKPKKDPQVKVSDSVSGNYVIVNVEVPKDAKGSIVLDFNSLIYSKVPVDGKTTFRLIDIDNGNYTYDVTFSGDEGYKSKVIKRSIEVNGAIKVNPTISVEDNDINEGEIATIVVTLSNDINEDIFLTIISRQYSSKPNNGKAVFNVSGLKASEYAYTVSFKGNGKYNSINIDGSIKVNPKVKSNPILNVVSDVNGNNVKINVEIEGATGDVTLKYSKNLTQALVEGKTSFDLSNLENGVYSYSVVYQGDDNYNGGEVTKSFEIKVQHVDSTIKAEDMNRSYLSGYDFEAIFTDFDGNLLDNKTVTFIINGNEYNVLTNRYGVAKLNTGFAPGVYDVAVINQVTHESLTKKMTIVDRITENKNINLDYSFKKAFRVKVFGDDGNAVGQGENVVFKVNGVKYTVQTDSKGYASVMLQNLKPGTYTISTEYRGVKVFNNVVVKQILKAKNAKFKKSKKVKKFKVTLKTSKGKAIKAKKITLKVKGKKYAAKTNSKGVATFKIKNLKKAGKFKATISYLQSTITKTIIVRR